MVAPASVVHALNRAWAFPLVVPAGRDGGGFEVHSGFVAAGARHFRVHVGFAPDAPSRTFACDAELAALLAPHAAVLRRRLERAADVGAFLVELKDVAERVLRDARAEALPPRDYYERLVGELAAVGWDSLASVGPSLRVIRLRAVDAAGREHALELELPPDYPRSPPRCSADLPAPLQLRWEDGAGRTLLAVARQHRDAVERYQAFWDVMDEFDSRCWVLEPAGPSRAVASRRVAVARHASLHVEVDPAQPLAVCECRFLGAEAAVGPLRSRLNERLFAWDAAATPLANLQRLLGVEFPPPTTATREEFTVECGICYSYRLDGAVPDRVCDNARCSRPFHCACLFEWLKALPDSRQSFGTVFGNCPYCRHPVTVSLS